MQKPLFSTTPLARGIALALGATAMAPALAQQANDEGRVIEEVTVTGIRSSLISSMNTKRGAKGVVDAITAEDIGKFPDTNLAESMQRIPGVSIDRENNEGSRVTARFETAAGSLYDDGRSTTTRQRGPGTSWPATLRPNSPPQMTSVSSNMPRCFKSLTSAALA